MEDITDAVSWWFSVKQVDLKDSAKSTKKHLTMNLFYDTVAVATCNLIKIETLP